MTVGLADPDEGRAQPQAQELAFRGLIETAVTLCDDPDDTGLWDFYDVHVEDTDIDMLFDPAMDGMEDPALHVNRMEPVNLEFERWFEPFGGS